MERLIKKFAVLLLFIFGQHVLLNAQKAYTSGQFKILYEIEHKEGADSTWLKEKSDYYEELTTNKFANYVFNDSIVVKVILDSLDKIQSRDVYNYSSGTITLFTYNGDKVYYELKKLTGSWLLHDVVNGPKTKDIRKNRKKNEIIGQWNVVSVPTYLGMFSVTSQIEMPYMKYTKPKSRNLVDSCITIKQKRNLYANQIWLNRELVEFSSSINNSEWLNDSVDGVENISTYWKFKSKKVISRNYKDISNGDNNVKAAIALINANRLPYYYYNKFVKGKSIGRLFIINNYKKLSRDTNATSIKIEKFHELNLISQKDKSYLESAFMKNKNWDYRKKSLFIFLYVLKLEFLEKEFRSKVVTNLKESPYQFNLRENEDSLFLENKIWIDQFLVTEKRIISSIDSEIIYSNQKRVFNEIKRILEPILIANNIEYEIISNQPKSSLTILSNGNKYVIDFTENIRKSKKNKSDDRRFINLNCSLINSWLNPIRQIFVDQNKKLLCGVNNWIEVFIANPDVGDYFNIIEQYPELQLVKDYMFISCYYENEAMDLTFGLEMESNQSNKAEIYEQYKLKPFLITGGLIVDYVNTDKKKKFLSYLFKSQKDFHLDKNGYKKIKDNILTGLFPDGYNFLEMIPKINLVLPRLDSGFPEMKSNSDFKDVFPEISKLINYEFKAKNLKVDPTSKYILEMEYNGKSVGVEKTKRSNIHSLIEFLNSHLVKKGKKIYSFQYGADWYTNYIYLTNDQKKGLEGILDLRI